MVITEGEPTADLISQAQFGAHLLEEPAGKAAPQDLVHHGKRGNVRIVAIRAHAHDFHVGLVYVFLVDEVNARLGSGKDVVASGLCLGRRQSFKGGAQLGLHGHGVEVAADAHDQLAADRPLVPGLQIVEGDRADGGQLRLAGVGAIGPVSQLGRLAFGDLGFIVVAANDSRGLLLLGQLELFLVEFGMQKQVYSQRKDLVRIAFERIP